VCSNFIRSFRILFQSEFSTESDLELRLSISSTLSFSEGPSVAAYVFILVFSSVLFSLISFH